MTALPVPPKRIFDPAFRYTKADHTDIRATFERVKAQQGQQQPERRQ